MNFSEPFELSLLSSSAIPNNFLACVMKSGGHYSAGFPMPFTIWWNRIRSLLSLVFIHAAIHDAGNHDAEPDRVSQSSAAVR